MKPATCRTASKAASRTARWKARSFSAPPATRTAALSTAASSAPANGALGGSRKSGDRAATRQQARQGRGGARRGPAPRLFRPGHHADPPRHLARAHRPEIAATAQDAVRLSPRQAEEFAALAVSVAVQSGAPQHRILIGEGERRIRLTQRRVRGVAQELDFVERHQRGGALLVK